MPVRVNLRRLLPLILMLGLLPTHLAFSAGKVDFERMGRESARMLADLVRLDTTNPPGNESLVADYLAGVLEREGLRYIRLARDDGRDNVIARFHGSGKGKPLLLYSHSDVVPADPGWGTWTVGPFSGEVRDGVLYGRGAIDAKGLLVCHLATMILLKRNNVALDRDVIFLAAAAEETGGGPGMSWLLSEKRDLIDAGTALGEGGRVWTRGDSVWSVWIQAGEKSAHNLTVTAVGKAGHAAIPSNANAIERLNRALVRIEDYQFEPKWFPLTEKFVEIIQPYSPRLVPGNPRYEAISRNTVSVTLIDGGIKTNVIPDFARANLNLRLLPGEDLGAVTRTLEQAAAEPGVTVRAKPGVSNGSSIVSYDTDFYHAIEKSAEELWPEAVVAPYLSAGTSDASKLRRAGILTYGLMPFPLTAEENGRIHGVDEQIRLDALTEGIRLMYGIVLEWATHDKR